jgi:hypothetical protein
LEVSGQLHASEALTRGKRPWYPLDRRMGGSQNLSGRPGGEKNLVLPGLELRPLGHPARSQSLYRLRYFGSPFVWMVVINNVKFCTKRLTHCYLQTRQSYETLRFCLRKTPLREITLAELLTLPLCAWIRVQVSFFLHSFLYKKSVGTVAAMNM